MRDNAAAHEAEEEVILDGWTNGLIQDLRLGVNCLDRWMQRNVIKNGSQNDGRPHLG